MRLGTRVRVRETGRQAVKRIGWHGGSTVRGVALAAALGLCLASPAAANQGDAKPAVRASYLYSLSNFTGTLPFTWARVVVDETQNEVYVTEGGAVSIFNAAGMEVHRFGDDLRLGHIQDVAPLESGDLLVLSYPSYGAPPELLLCDYRGELKGRIAFSGFPQDLELGAHRMLLRGERLYLVDMTEMRLAVVDRAGAYQRHHDLGALIGLEGEQVANAGLGGFDAGPDGSLYFTVPTEFRAYRLSPEGTLETFGEAGSAPGRFGVVAGIAADRFGNVYVADTLKCVVMAFDEGFRFLGEFGYRSTRPEGLVAPRDPTVSGDGRLYVTQQARRGVSVYRVTAN